MSERRPRILLTGAAGRIGQALLADLIDEFEFVPFDRVPIEGWPSAVVGDITDRAALSGAVAGVDAVVHLAANASKHATFDELRAANIDGTYGSSKPLAVMG
jgi:NAD+ dependent glucose-6-phosphate dehydrogenase